MKLREWVPADELFCFRANNERLLWVRLEKERTRTHVAFLEDHEKEVTALRPERIGTRPPCLRSAVRRPSDGTRPVRRQATSFQPTKKETKSAIRTASRPP
jgi:hypothetical protein